MSTYRIIITTNPDRVATFFTENGLKWLWSVHRPHDGRMEDEMPAIARGDADTRWGARCAAKRAIKNWEHTAGAAQVVYDKMWQP